MFHFENDYHYYFDCQAENLKYFSSHKKYKTFFVDYLINHIKLLQKRRREDENIKL